MSFNPMVSSDRQLGSLIHACSNAWLILAAPAYMTVNVRQGFSQQPPADQKVEWPDSVRAYVQRAFQEANLIPDVSMDELKEKLNPASV